MPPACAGCVVSRRIKPDVGLMASGGKALTLSLSQEAVCLTASLQREDRESSGAVPSSSAGAAAAAPFLRPRLNCSTMEPVRGRVPAEFMLLQAQRISAQSLGG